MSIENTEIISLVNGPVLRFNEFIDYNKFEKIDALEFLMGLNNNHVNDLLKKLVPGKKSKNKEFIEDILLEIGDIIDDQRYLDIDTELNKKY